MSSGERTGPVHAGLENDVEDLYEHAPCALLSTLPDGTIIRANHTFYDWLGTSSEAIVGRQRFQALLTIGSRIYYETHYSPLLQMQGFVNEIALEIRRIDGSVRPVVASAQELRHADGTARVNRVALFDSTDRRRYEQELLHARERAEESARQLEMADRRKTEFIATLAHELRNPLAPIRNALEIQRQAGHDQAILDKTGQMLRRQVTQMVRLVEDLLDVSRIGQDKLSIERAVVDLASVIHHAAEASQPLLEDAAVEYTETLPATPVYVDADAARLAQAIGNILNNASKFTPRGGAVAVSLERDGPEAVIRIRDTGVGIEPAKLPRIFDMFMQADASSVRTGGLGIGLTLARTLLERQDGSISVHSDGPGTGTEFVIRLPALVNPPASVTPARAQTPPVRAVAKRILVVDDNHDSADVMSMLLGMAGHEVRVAHDGLAAVESAASFEPHVVLLDIGLPKLNGYEVAERIRRHPGPQPVLVALTGWGQAEDRRRAADAGFDVHLVKPVDHDQLAEVIRSAPLERRR